MDPLEMAMMMGAYVRRKQWEAERTAEAIWSVLGKALNVKRTGTGTGGGNQTMSGMQLLNTIGVEG